jgi:predicted HTH domain antitoxin
LRIKLAIYSYCTEGVSLAKAASLIGVSSAHMKDVVLERGIEPRLGAETMEEAEREVHIMREYF